MGRTDSKQRRFDSKNREGLSQNKEGPIQKRGGSDSKSEGLVDTSQPSHLSKSRVLQSTPGSSLLLILK